MSSEAERAMKATPSEVWPPVGCSSISASPNSIAPGIGSAWYEPKKLAIYDSPKPGLFPLTPLKIISPAAYTQGWTWRVAQAHPMGYSELRFGYWAQDPLPLDDYIKVS